jgi:hypothetical protein
VQSRRVELLILAAILLPLLTLRFSLHSAPGPYGVDGSYYLQVARNVAEGKGLVTNVDLYHQALPTLPAKTNIYPAWPLLLGYTARVIGLDVAVHHLPRALYGIALLVLYGTVRRISRDAHVIGSLNIAHLTVALFGTTEVFFSATTYPYTEGLAFTLSAAALWALTTRSARSSFAAGVFAGLAVLSRSQMLMLVPAGLFTLALVAVRDREWKRLCAFGAGVAVTIGPWLYWISTFARPFSLRLLYASYHGSPAVGEYPLGRPAASWGDFLSQSLEGLRVAFNPWSGDSFVALYGAAALLVPLAVVHYLARVRRTGLSLDVGLVALVLAGALLSFMLIVRPQQFFRPWLFAWRHGLPLIFLIAAAAIELIGKGTRLVQWASVALLSLSIVTGAARVVKTVAAGPPPGPTGAERQLSAWLQEHDPNAIVLTTNAQVLAAYSRANFRWAECHEDAAITRNLLRSVRTDYVAIYEQQTQCEFVAKMADVLQPIARFGPSPRAIYLLRVKALNH